MSKVFFATRQNENDKQFCARSQCVIFAKENLNIFDWSGKDVIFHLHIKPALFDSKGFLFCPKNNFIEISLYLIGMLSPN